MEEALEEHRRRKERKGRRDIQGRTVVGDVKHHAQSAFTLTWPVVKCDDALYCV